MIPLLVHPYVPRIEEFILAGKAFLTQKQQAVLEFIARYLGEHRSAPLIREVQLGCQIASYKSAIDRLNALEHKGFIKRTPNKHRGIRIIRRAVEGFQAKLAVPAVSQDRQGAVV